MSYFNFRRAIASAGMLLLLASAASSIHAQTLTEVFLPQYIQGLNGTNNDRIPYAFRATLSGLTANATYNFFNGVVISSDASTSNGAGNCIFVTSSGSWVRTSGVSLASAGNFGTFTTDGTGSYTGWFIVEPSGNATRFIPGNQIFMRIMLNDGAGGTTVVTRLTTTNFVTVVNWGTGSTAVEGSGIIGMTGFPAKSFAMLYDNTAGTGRPIAGSLVEDDGVDVPDGNYVDFHDTAVDNTVGKFGVIVPNILPNGIRRIENRSMTNGSLVSAAATSANGTWSSTSTVNPTGGKALPITIPLFAGPVGDNPNIAASPATVYVSASDPVTTGTAQVVITNTGSSAALIVTSTTLLGAGASRFKIVTPLPSGIAAGTSTTLTVRYNGGGSTAITSATLRIGSNDQSNDVAIVTLFGAAAPNMKPYRGLVISEVSSQPTSDEFVEIKNTTNTAINIAGVIISDEDNNNTEGAISFPAGTSIASGEVVVVAMNSATTEPLWLDTVPAGVRVFYEPARNAAGWTALHGNTLIKMNDYVTTAGGTSSSIQLSGGDGVALYAPATRILPAVGPFPTTATIDGMNYPQGDSGPSNPINQTGAFDTPLTKAGTAESAVGHSLTRTNSNPNTNSFSWFVDQLITPGTSNLPLQTPPVNAAHQWTAYF